MNGLLFANVAASAAICLILLLRKIFRERFFAKFFVLLWILVIFRLLLPFEFSSGLSFYKPVSEPEIHATDSFVWEEIPEGGVFVPKQDPEVFSESRKSELSSEKILFYLWISGAVFTEGFFFLKHRFSVKRILADSVPLENVSADIPFGKTRVFKSRNLCSPLSFGILRPTVVIPEDTDEKQLPFVLLHEQTHLLNRDPALKILALFALSMNWFNPAVWFMVKFFDRDIERFCDERVLRILGNEKAFDYANTILDFAERESLLLNFFSASSLCERVTSIMKNKNKKSRLFSAAAIFLCVVLLMTACGTVPAPEEKEPLSTGNLSADNSKAEEIDKLLQEYMEVQLSDNTIAIVDIESGETAAVVKIDPSTGRVVSVDKSTVNILTEIPGFAEELMGYYGDVPPNNYVTDTYSINNIGKIEKITVSGFSFAEGSSVNVLLIPSEETYVSITYGDVLRENGLYVDSGNNEIKISVGTPCENIEEAFDLRIYGNFDEAEINIENLGYSFCSVIPEKNLSTIPEGDYEPGDKLVYLAVDDFELQLLPPVKEGWLAVGFGAYKGHSGIDIGSESGRGTDILAVADGEVVKVKWDKTGYGYHIIINHGNGIQTLYAHCSELLVELGQEVKAGDIIAKMGATGNSTGIHLHFELRVNGEYIDPESFFFEQ